MTSGITLSSMSLVRNPQHPPSTPFLDPSFLTHLQLSEISTRNFQGIFLGLKNIIHDIRNDPVLHVSGQEPSTSSKYPPSWPTLLETLLIKISTQNFHGIFLGVKIHHSWCQEWPSPPCLWSGTLNVLQLPPSWPPLSWHISNKDIYMKLTGYLPWVKIRTSKMFGMTLSSIYPVRYPQYPPRTPL